MPNESIVLQKSKELSNLKFTDNTSEIKIVKDGVYILHTMCQFDQPCEIALFINDKPDMTTITASNNGCNIVILHTVVGLRKDDIVSIRNYISYLPLTTSNTNSGLKESNNITLTLCKIASLKEDYDSDDSHSSKFCKEEPGF